MSTAVHLAFKEIWRNRGRFLLFSGVVAMITLLILFLAALGEGLGSGQREYLDKLNADLIVYKDTARLQIPSSRIGCAKRQEIGRVEGVRDVGAIGFSSVAVIHEDLDEPMDVSLIGVEPGMPGEPPVEEGSGFVRRSSDEVILDRVVALMTGLQVGDELIIRSTQGREYEFFALQVAGITESRKYSLQASIFVPIVTWDKIRPKGAASPGQEDPACNVAAVQLEDPAQIDTMKARIEAQVEKVEAVDRQTAYESTPGYTEQQSTLNAQNGFALLIGVLVIGGFFQIQTLQKVPQIGMLKAIGTPNRTVALAAMVQIVIVTVVGAALGSLAAFGLSFAFPPNVPIIFEPRSGAMAVVSILLIGPIGGLVAVRNALRVEPLVALGLG